MIALRARLTSPIASVTLPVLLLTGLSAVFAVQSGLIGYPTGNSQRLEAPPTIVIPAGSFSYRADGEYFKNGYGVDGPLNEITVRGDLTIMKYQVTRIEYTRCVADGICATPEPGFPATHQQTPVTGVSHDDARLYAAWLSDRTGEVWQLPNDQQLAFAAGSRFPDEALGVDAESTNPALRWLADYNRETARKASRDPVPQATGTFGENEHELADFGGNIWEWTATCSQRVNLNENGDVMDSVRACGIYVASGKHRATLSSFVRNPKGGGCSVGAPPDNLGFRLIKDTRWYAPILFKLRERGL